MDYLDYSRDLLRADESFGFDIERFLEESQEREQQRLEEELERIDQQLEEREEIRDDVVVELESKLDWYVDRLKELYQRKFFNDKEKKEHLKAKIEEFYSELRQERRRAWRDKQELEKERRKLLRELNELDDQNLQDLLG
ncbi:hypothetical protein [Halorhabdus salina]|uniref:hypothetical protein n=1 Tax=Halorhabdus salina TaxID=2750670 RepID=UPI001C6625D7|nr:hypothetical protein [Halorhabdus salina]